MAPSLVEPESSYDATTPLPADEARAAFAYDLHAAKLRALEEHQTSRPKNTKEAYRLPVKMWKVSNFNTAHPKPYTDIALGVVYIQKWCRL